MKPRRSTVPHLIIHVVHRFGVGGLENGVVNLIDRLPADRWRHAVLALTEIDPNFLLRVSRKDVTCIALHKPPGHGFKLYPTMYRVFRRLRPAIVHTRNLAALEASVPAWAAGVPIRIHGEHGWDVRDPDGSNAKYRAVRRLYRPFVHRYLALSLQTQNYLVSAVGIEPWRVEHVYNGVDTERFLPADNGRAPIEGSPFDDPRLFLIGTVGRLDPVKDQTTLVEAFAIALRKQSALRLIIVGDGPYRATVERTIAAHGIQRQVWLAGERADVPEIMRGLDCFVLPSLAEGISNTILEAMSSALPVIATRVGANSDLMEDGDAGPLVPRSDPVAMAEAIVALAVEPSAARRFGRSGRAIVERRFGLGQMVRRYADIYEGLLADCGVAPRLDHGPAEATRETRA